MPERSWGPQTKAPGFSEAKSQKRQDKGMQTAVNAGNLLESGRHLEHEKRKFS